MNARFELSVDPNGRHTFSLRGDDGATLLHGLKGEDRIRVGIDILHVRRAVRELRNFVAHRAPDGVFVVLKNASGEVLAKSPHLPAPALKALVQLRTS